RTIFSVDVPGLHRSDDDLPSRLPVQCRFAGPDADQRQHYYRRCDADPNADADADADSVAIADTITDPGRIAKLERGSRLQYYGPGHRGRSYGTRRQVL